LTEAQEETWIYEPEVTHSWPVQMTEPMQGGRLTDAAGFVEEAVRVTLMGVDLCPKAELWDLE
jgi:hypothetical protein